MNISNTDHTQAAEPGAILRSTEEAAARFSAMTLFGIIMRRHVWPAHETGGAALGLKSVETLGIGPWRLASLVRIAPQLRGQREMRSNENFQQSIIRMRKY